jgi:transcriptional regulator with XRE-family HTH domain
VPKAKDILTARVRERLAALRDAHGLTDSGLARAAHQRQQDVSRFFNGDMKFPPLDFMHALSQVFDRTLADVLAMDVTRTEKPEWQARVIVALKAMQPSERLAFETLLTRGKGGAENGLRRGRREGR